MANDSKYDLGYLNKIDGECNNTYHHSIVKKTINSGYSN